MRKKYMVLLGTAVFFGAGILIVYILSVYRPVLYSYRQPGRVTPGPTFVIFNPFRNRGAEMASEQVLSQIRDGRCEYALSEINLAPTERTAICTKEEEYKLEDWSLTNRTDQENFVILEYGVKRKGYEGFHSNATTTVGRFEGNWKVTSLEFIY